MAQCLSVRMAERQWTRWTKNDLSAQCQYEVPVAGLLDMQRQLNVKRGPKRARRCALCDTPCRTKCSHCLTVHCCSFGCQRQDWPNHRTVCQQPSPQIAQYVVVAVPDYHCFWEYQERLVANYSESDLVVCILSRDVFTTMFGEDATRRTVLNLAVHGRPHLYVASLFSPRQTPPRSHGLAGFSASTT